MPKNLVSIVIATYNRANLIAETLDSVLAQTYEHWECVIVDDGSSDNTEEVVAKYAADARIRFFKRPPDRIKGPNASRNYGIENSFGEFIMSLDSDDWILPDYLQKKIKIFTDQPEIDGVLSKTIMVNNEKEIIKKELRTKLTNNLLEDFISLNVSWYMHDILWKKGFLKDKILYNEKLLKMLDRDFHIRRLIEKPNLFLVDEYLALYRIHENSNSSNSDYNVAESRHNAILQIISSLKNENQLSDKMKFYLFKHQVQNLVVLYKHPECFSLYVDLICKTFNFDKAYLKWLLKLSAGYVSFKLVKRGLRFVQ